jgi:pilus assembly protein Flp/PilA
MKRGDKFSWPGTGSFSIQLPGCCVRMRNLITALADESGQDLIEYALVVALIALGATASMTSVAASISGAFTNVSIKVSTYTS